MQENDFLCKLKELEGESSRLEALIAATKEEKEECLAEIVETERQVPPCASRIGPNSRFRSAPIPLWRGRPLLGRS